jgi:hypothetical protein
MLHECIHTASRIRGPACPCPPLTASPPLTTRALREERALAAAALPVGPEVSAHQVLWAAATETARLQGRAAPAQPAPTAWLNRPHKVL